MWGWSSIGRIVFNVDLSIWDMTRGGGLWVVDMSAPGRRCGARTWLGPLAIFYASYSEPSKTRKCGLHPSLEGRGRPPALLVARGRGGGGVSSPGLAQHGQSPGT